MLSVENFIFYVWHCRVLFFFFSMFFSVFQPAKMTKRKIKNNFFHPCQSALFALEQGRKWCSAANSLLAALKPVNDRIWNRLLLLEKKKCSQLPPWDECKLQYVCIHGFVRRSHIPVNLGVLLYCHKPNLGNVISPNWQRGLGKYSPLLWSACGCGRWRGIVRRVCTCFFACAYSTCVSTRRP